MKTMPEAKQVQLKQGVTRVFDSIRINAAFDLNELLAAKLWNLPKLKDGGEKPVQIDFVQTDEVPGGVDDAGLFLKQGYVLDIEDDGITIRYAQTEGLINAISTWKQTLLEQDGGFVCQKAHIVDWPSIEVRSLSVTLAWYAGYGRLGFDMQLWDFSKWKEFLHICSDYKINQLNVVLYGFWPFVFRKYPESTLRGIKMKVWNEESNNWVTVEYMHPNLDEEFLPQLIEYGHSLGIRFFAYIGLNSYSGGYTCIHRENRMKLPAEGKFINDFDSLCLSNEENIVYLKASMRKIVEQGFDGFDFEESEEAFWYCNCDKCKETFWKGAATPEETLHVANSALLKLLYDEIKAANPSCAIGIRAWRQPPLIRPDSLIRKMVESVPDDILLFWAPGQYVPEDEFEKWVKAFGRERIYARDTEAIGFASGWGRLVRLFKWNGLRCEEESITQFIEEDIRQHRGSVAQKVKGINGYLFEWYGFFMAFFAHSYFGWGGTRGDDDFYRYALEAVFGDIAEDIWDVLRRYFVIHESQITLYKLEFPFARNKVQERDRARIEQAIKDNPELIAKLKGIRSRLSENGQIAHFEPHFKKLQVTLERCEAIYRMALLSLELDKAGPGEKRTALLQELYALNEMDFDVIKANYFDVNPVVETGVKSCMFPYHEIKRCILNELDPTRRDDVPVYPGVEALGWLWA